MYVCVVCGYDKLEVEQYNNRLPNFSVCKCCGFQSGYDDLDQGYTFAEYREKWINDGAKWFKPNEMPSDWDLVKQLKKL